MICFAMFVHLHNIYLDILGGLELLEAILKLFKDK